MSTVTGTAKRKSTSCEHKASSLIVDYQAVRSATEILCEPLETDDFLVQTMPDVSPVKWHIAHVSWFFETFLLKPYLKNYRIFHPQYGQIFNSYYETVGKYHPRPERGLLNRPTLNEVFAYRAYINEHMFLLLSDEEHGERDEIEIRTRIGINHEQQHQELMLTDIKHVFATNPLKPAYQDKALPTVLDTPGLHWQAHEGGLLPVGHMEENGFCYDNEMPSHQVFIAPFKLASHLVTNGEYIEFINDRGYTRVDLWLSDAWSTLKQRQWQAPLYWYRQDDQWWHMTLNGAQPVDLNSPVCHISFYEADAFARWADKRLPGEEEWEVVARDQKVEGNLRSTGHLHPVATMKSKGLQQLYGDVWEWTQSPYRPYPGFKALPGSLGEYNGKFMCSQFVLRGGSCVTPADHIRSTYRNFFYPADRWQFSGLRLAEDC